MPKIAHLGLPSVRGLLCLLQGLCFFSCSVLVLVLVFLRLAGCLPKGDQRGMGRSAVSVCVGEPHRRVRPLVDVREIAEVAPQRVPERGGRAVPHTVRPAHAVYDGGQRGVVPPGHLREEVVDGLQVHGARARSRRVA